MRSYVLKREVIASEGEVFVGLDVHRSSVSATVLDDSGTVVHRAKFDADRKHLDQLVERLQGARVRVACEAGPCGFAIARHLASQGCDVIVAAPSKIPSASGDRVKTDARDSVKLAELLREGLLRRVYVPSIESERRRELTRTREQLVCARRRVHVQLRAKLLFHDIVTPSELGGHSWSEALLAWLEHDAVPGGDPIGLALDALVRIARDLGHEIEELEGQMKQATGSLEHSATIARLRTAPGVGPVTAAVFVSEIHDPKRFELARAGSIGVQLRRSSGPWAHHAYRQPALAGGARASRVASDP